MRTGSGTRRGPVCRTRSRPCILAADVERLSKKTRTSRGREGMSRALAVFHGRFGRATVYQLNRPFNIHAHREGHLIFHVGGTPARIDVCDERWLLTEDSIVAVNPWEPHNFVPTDLDERRDLLRALRQRRMVRARCGAAPTACGSAAPVSSAPPRSTGISGRIRGAGVRRALAQQPRLRTAAADRQLLRRELAESEPVRGAAQRRRRHRFSRAQVDQADVGKPGRRDRTGFDRARRRGCRVRISTGCSAPRPASRRTSISIP